MAVQLRIIHAEDRFLSPVPGVLLSGWAVLTYMAVLHSNWAALAGCAALLAALLDCGRLLDSAWVARLDECYATSRLISFRVDLRDWRRAFLGRVARVTVLSTAGCAAVAAVSFVASVFVNAGLPVTETVADCIALVLTVSVVGTAWLGSATGAVLLSMRSDKQVKHSPLVYMPVLTSSEVARAQERQAVSVIRMCLLFGGVLIALLAR